MPILPGTKESEIEILFFESSINLLLVEKGTVLSFSIPFERRNVNNEFDLILFSSIRAADIDALFPGAAFIRPSSGTTGSSKGVVISHQSVFERTAAANDGLQLNELSIMLWVLPMAFHFIVSILLYVRYGVCMIVSEHFTATSLIELSNRFNATHLYASPLHFRLLASEKEKLQFTTMRKVISTSAQLESSVSKVFFEKYGIAVSQAYGIIEIGLPFINNELHNLKRDSIGKVLPQYLAAILDNNMNETGTGIQGQLAICGPGMFSGYLWPLKKLSEALFNNWFLTGDIAEIDSDGYVFIKGRSKSMINVSGNKVFPEEVEAVLKMHPGIEDVKVYGGKHPVTGEIVEAQVVLKSSGGTDAEAIIAMCREHLAPYKIPQRIYFVDAIPKTKTGKISRA